MRSSDPVVATGQSDRSSRISLINILDQLSDASGITLAQSQTVHVPARLEQSGDPALLALPDLSAVITSTYPYYGYNTYVLCKNLVHNNDYPIDLALRVTLDLGDNNR
jgi:hypothetical protein